VNAHESYKGENYKGDIKWLRDTSCRKDMESFIGYAVLVQDTKATKLLSCVRVQAGAARLFLRLPKIEATDGDPHEQQHGQYQQRGDQ
jgi:hypothetical protein